MPMTDHHEEILQAIERLDRAPIQRLLARNLSVMPELEPLQQFANKYPDRHAQAIAILTRQVGYSEAPHLTVSIEAKVRTLSDAELSRAYIEMMHQLAQLRAQHEQSTMLQTSHQSQSTATRCISSGTPDTLSLESNAPKEREAVG